MKGIGTFFEKFKSSAVKEIKKRVAISNILKKEIGEEIPIENISISNGVIKIKSSSMIKSQIFIKKIAILRVISTTLQGLFVKDIQ